MLNDGRSVRMFAQFLGFKPPLRTRGVKSLSDKGQTGRRADVGRSQWALLSWNFFVGRLSEHSNVILLRFPLFYSFYLVFFFPPLQRTYTVIVEAWDWDNGTRSSKWKQCGCFDHLSQRVKRRRRSGSRCFLEECEARADK